MYQKRYAFSLCMALWLIISPALALTIVIWDNLTLAALQDFGISCNPSTFLLTALYVLGTVSFQFLIGTFLAIVTLFWAQASAPKLIVIVAALTVPYAIPSTVGYTMYEFLLAHGSAFQQTFFPTGSPLNGTWSRFVVMVTLGVWQYFPLVFITVLASLLATPPQLILTARSDGASAALITRRILLPNAAPILLTIIGLRTVLMLTKIDAPLAFQATTTGDYACLAAIRIKGSISLDGRLPLGLLLAVFLATLIVISSMHILSRRLS